MAKAIIDTSFGRRTTDKTIITSQINLSDPPTLYILF